MKKVSVFVLVLTVCFLCACSLLPAQSELTGTDTSSSQTSPLPSPTPAYSSLSEIRSRGTLRVGMTYFGWSWFQNNGEWCGWEADYARALAKDLGVEPEFVEYDLAQELFSDLAAGKLDLVMAGIEKGSLAAEREYLSTDAYNLKNDDYILLIRSEDLDRYKTVADFKNARIATRSAGSYEASIKALSPDATVTVYPDSESYYTDLKENKVDAVAEYAGNREAYLEFYTWIALSDVTVPDVTADKAMYVALGNTALCDYLNTEIKLYTENGSVRTWNETAYTLYQSLGLTEE